MHMVLDTSHDDGLAIEATQDAAQVAVQFPAQSPVAQERAALFGGEDGVKDDPGQRLWHVVRMRRDSRGCNPFRVDGFITGLLPG
jgi:hypothetical protein